MRDAQVLADGSPDSLGGDHRHRTGPGLRPWGRVAGGGILHPGDDLAAPWQKGGP